MTKRIRRFEAEQMLKAADHYNLPPHAILALAFCREAARREWNPRVRRLSLFSSWYVAVTKPGLGQVAVRFSDHPPSNSHFHVGVGSDATVPDVVKRVKSIWAERAYNVEKRLGSPDDDHPQNNASPRRAARDPR
jgi:hypothetical protein